MTDRDLFRAGGKGHIPVFWPDHKPQVMRWPMLAGGDSRIRVGGNLASDQPNIGS